MAARFIHSRERHLSRALDIFLRALSSSLGSIVRFTVFIVIFEIKWPLQGTYLLVNRLIFLLFHPFFAFYYGAWSQAIKSGAIEAKIFTLISK